MESLLAQIQGVPTADLEELCATLAGVEGFDQLALAQQALASGDAESTVLTLGKVESRLGAALGAHVAGRYNELITEVDAVRSLESQLAQSHQHVERLAASVRRVKASTVGQHAALRGRVAQLEHMQQCAGMLRRMQRLLQVCRRLHEAVDASRSRAPAESAAGAGGTPGGSLPAARRIELSSAELPKAALAICEAEALLLEEALDGIAVAEAEIQFSRSVGAAVRRQADAMLREGMRNLNQTSLGTALQVIFCLCVLFFISTGS